MARTNHQINIIGREYLMPIEDHEHPIKGSTQMIEDMTQLYTNDSEHGS